MRIRTTVCMIAAAILAACGSAGEVGDRADGDAASAEGYLVGAYHPWWTQGAWRTYELSTYDEVYFFSVEIDSAGMIAERNGWPDRWFAMQRSLNEAGVRVTPAVTLFSQSAFERIFGSDETSDRLQHTLLDLLRDSPGAGGLQLDFEVYRPVADSVREGFTRFVRSLHEAMNRLRPDLVLSAYLVAYDESDVFDEAALARAADYLVIQGYDLHGRREGRTGPVAALEGWGQRNWRAIVSRLVDLGVPRSKIVMSVPYFGYEWPAESDEPGARTRGGGVTVAYTAVDSSYVRTGPPSALERAERHGLRRDSLSGSPYYAFMDSTGSDTAGWRQGWFEDSESLGEKYRFIRDEGLRGVAVFPAAYGNDELAAVLNRTFNGTLSEGASR